MLVSLPKKPKRPHKTKPKLLLDSSIPRPLHGVNPRTIRGKVWWDRERKAAYAYNADHCHACGVHKRDAKLFSWLEAHEIYTNNYAKHRTTFVGIVALCHCCHAVIHAGRTTNIYLDGTLSEKSFETIVEHGKKHFKKWKLAKPIQFRYMELIYEGMPAQEAGVVINKEYPNSDKIILSSWSLWRLEFNGKLYPPVFKSAEEWSKHYGN
jgi:hypothetical protein